MLHETLDQWLSWLEDLHPKKWDLGLERVGLVAQRMGLLVQPGILFLIAGTNGKGSTVALLEAIARSHGYRTGSATSPHLLRFNERIRIDGAEATDESICESFERINLARNEISLTYFEFAALAALDLFKRAELDVALLEVGLGGRLDAMNITSPQVTVLTGVELDHQAWLGDDRETIGAEKAAIFRRGVPAIVGDMDPPRSVIAAAHEVEAPIYCREQKFGCSSSNGRWGFWGVDHESREVRFDNLPLPDLHLDNAAIAIQAWLQCGLELDPVLLADALSGTSLSARCQFFDGNVPLILDVAHNPQAGANLARRLTETPCAGMTYAVIAMYGDKDCETFLSALDPVVDRWFMAGMEESRGASAADLVNRLSRGESSRGESSRGESSRGESSRGESSTGKLSSGHRSDVSTYDRVGTAYLDALKQVKTGDRIVVTGSFPAVATILQMVSTG